MRVSKILYIGFEVGVKDSVSEILGDPPKPGNWKQETYEAKLDELREKQAATAHNDMRAGDIKDIVILDPENGAHCSVSLPELKTLVEQNDEVYVLGFSPRFRLQQAAWAVKEGAPKWIWCDGFKGVELVDLYKLSGAKNDGMKLVDMVNFWLPEGIQAESAAEQEALAAKAIAEKMGLTEAGVLHYA